MAERIGRRNFLSSLGVTVGAVTLASAVAPVLVSEKAEAAEPPTGKIPDKPLKMGHMTYFTGPGAVLGEPSYKGHILAADLSAFQKLTSQHNLHTIVCSQEST